MRNNSADYMLGGSLHSKGVVKVEATQKEVIMEDLTGKQLGSYQIIAPLGEGGMAAVYKAYQLGKMNRYVALKVLPQQLAKQPEFVGRFNQEANVLAKLQHPRILPVFDFGEAEGYTYIVMPFVDSGTLADSLHGKPLPLPQVRSFTVQVAEALDYAHTRGLVHRDVKPSNVLVDERGNCLLSDFGISKILEGTEKFTTTGGIIGTPAYMSPEQGRGETLDQRSDIYSLGVMLYEMATGRVPYKADTPLAVIIKHMQDPLPSPRSINPSLPEAVEQVIFKALAKHGEDRYQTAGEMARAVQLAIRDSPFPETPSLLHEATKVETPPSAMPQPERAPTLDARPKGGMPIWIWGLIGAVTLVLAIGGGFWALNLGTFPFSRPATATSIVVTQSLAGVPTATLSASSSFSATATTTRIPTETPPLATSTIVPSKTPPLATSTIVPSEQTTLLNDIPFTYEDGFGSGLIIHKVWAQNTGTNVEFWFDYTSDVPRGMSFFNPPAGDIISIQKDLPAGTNSVSIVASVSALQRVSNITVNFYIRGVALTGRIFLDFRKIKNILP